MRTRTMAGLVILATLVAAPAWAQTTGSNELTVFGGLSLSDISVETDEHFPMLRRFEAARLILPPFPQRVARLDGSAEIGVRYGRAITDLVTVEADFSVAPSHTLDERLSFGCPEGMLCIAGPEPQWFVPDIRRTERLAAYHYGGGIRLALMDGAVRPAVVGGIGGVTFDGAGLRESHLALRVGGAVAASIGDLTATVEVVDVIVSNHFLTRRGEHEVHVRLGLGVRW